MSVFLVVVKKEYRGPFVQVNARVNVMANYFDDQFCAKLEQQDGGERVHWTSIQTSKLSFEASFLLSFAEKRNETLLAPSIIECTCEGYIFM